jgi:hypothetical protein
MGRRVVACEFSLFGVRGFFDSRVFPGCFLGVSFLVNRTKGIRGLPPLLLTNTIVSVGHTTFKLRTA